MKIGIIGAGMVGGAIEHCFAHAHELFVHDPARGTELKDVIDHVDMAYIPTGENIADLVTKHLKKSTHDYLCDKFGVDKGPPMMTRRELHPRRMRRELRPRCCVSVNCKPRQ